MSSEVIDSVIEKAESLPMSEWEIGDTLDVIDCYDEEVIVTAEIDGVDVEGTGMVSCGDLVSIRDIEIKR